MSLSLSSSALLALDQMFFFLAVTRAQLNEIAEKDDRMHFNSKESKKKTERKNNDDRRRCVLTISLFPNVSFLKFYFVSFLCLLINRMRRRLKRRFIALWSFSSRSNGQRRMITTSRWISILFSCKKHTKNIRKMKKKNVKTTLEMHAYARVCVNVCVAVRVSLPSFFFMFSSCLVSLIRC